MKLSMKSLAFAAAACFLPVAMPSLAGPATQALGQCLTKSTTPEDDILLMRWLFAMMSKHPKVADLAAVSPQEDDRVNRDMAALFERLLVKDCVTETRAAIAADGPSAIETAFGALGEKAFGVIEQDPAVDAAAGKFANYLDLEKIGHVMTDAPATK